MVLTKHPQFIKHFQKRIQSNRNLVSRYKQRISLFIEDPRNPIIKDHQLGGAKKNYRAFWITGDIRVTYRKISSDEVILYDIGSHNQVY